VAFSIQSIRGENSASNGKLSGLADSTFYPVIHLPLANPMKETVSKTESYPMNRWFSLSCDRYGHLITAKGGLSPKINRSREILTTEQVAPDPPVAQLAEKRLEKPAPHDLLVQTTAEKSPVRRMLVPIDADHVQPADLKPILKVARRFDAEVTLLHIYSTPPSFDYAVGATALVDVSLHRSIARTRLLKLCADVQKFFAKCRCEFAIGSLPEEILRASENLHADLIAVPVSLDFVSHCWTTRELLDELVRRANCPVLGVPSV
jgi:nucleotide-binding universal stress UspA family protein